MSTPQDVPTHGFRHDPMGWALSDEAPEAAIVRKQVLRRPAEGDEQVLSDAIGALLAGQNSDGGFGEEGKETAGALLKMLDLGVASSARELRAAGEALGRRVAAGATSTCAGDEATELPMAIGDARALCGIGETAAPELHATLRWHADNVDLWINRGCPWGQAATITALAAGRGVLDIEDGLREALTWASEAVNGAGCISYFDPWSFVEIAATTDHPLAGAMLRKQLTLILRTQSPDGGWTMPDWWPTSQNSTVVFRALSRHGLLDVLRGLPPLPPGYKIGRTVATPAGDLWGLAWDGQAWWTCDEATNTAISFSGADGAVLRTVELPQGAGRGLGCWDGAPTLAQGSPWEKDPKRIVRVDPRTGACLAEMSLDCLNHAGGVAAVDGHVWVADSFFGRLFCFDGDGEVVREHVSLAGPLPVGLAADGDTLWHDDLWVPFFIRTGLDDGGQFVDCIEKPFREPFAPKPYGGVTRGMGHNDEGLWVIDREHGRIIQVGSAAPDGVAA